MKHPVSINHPKYDSLMKVVERVRDCVAGQPRVKEQRTKYLPMMGSAEDYDAYLERAMFYNATGRTLLGLDGALNMAAPSITFDLENPIIAHFVNQVHSLQLVPEQLESSRACLLISRGDGDALPSCSLWFAESIVNWKMRTVNGLPELKLLVLETSEASSGVFDHNDTRVRYAYTINELGLCTQQQFLFVDDDWIATDAPQVVMSAGGRELTYIPAIIVGATAINQLYIERPVLADLADINLSHYMNSADLEHGRHWTALPTAWASGFPTHDTSGAVVKFVVGGKSAWITEQQGAACGYLEFTGAGLGHLAEGLRDKQAMMAVQGARILEEAKAAGEAADTIRQRLIGEKSVLRRIAITASEAKTWAIRELVKWQLPVTEVEGSYEVNADFLTSAMDSGMLATLVSALQSDAISYSTFFHALKNGGLIPEGRTLDDEKKEIEENPQRKDPFEGGSSFGGGWRG
jgi:hypothetical protein